MPSWRGLIYRILENPPHVDITISKHLVANPLEEGFTETFLSEPQGQLRDYELTLPDGKRIHVREFEGQYRAHWDIISPSVDVLEHLRRDAPHWLVTLCSLGASAIAYLISRDTEKAISAAVLGFLLGVVITEE